MKKGIFMFLALGLIMTSCTVDYNYVTQNVALTDYTAMKVDGVIDVIMNDTVTTAHIVAPEDMMDNIICEVNNEGKLIITRRDFTVIHQGLITVYLPTNANLQNVEVTGSSDFSGHLTASNLNIKTDGSSKLSVSCAALTMDVNATNASHMYISNSCDSTTIDAEAELSSNIEIKTLGNAANVDVKAENSSKINLSGISTKLELKADGSSTIDARNFVAINVDVNLNNASTAYVNCSGILSGELENASKLYYTGTPQTISVSKCTSCTLAEL